MDNKILIREEVTRRLLSLLSSLILGLITYGLFKYFWRFQEFSDVHSVAEFLGILFIILTVVV